MKISRFNEAQNLLTRLEAVKRQHHDLSVAVSGGRESQSREFTMRIPAECDRDADLVLSEAAHRIEQLRARVADLEHLIRYAQVESGVCMCGEDMDGHSLYSGHSPVDIWDNARDWVINSSLSD